MVMNKRYADMEIMNYDKSTNNNITVTIDNYEYSLFFQKAFPRLFTQHFNITTYSVAICGNIY